MTKGELKKHFLGKKQFEVTGPNLFKLFGRMPTIKKHLDKLCSAYGFVYKRMESYDVMEFTPIEVIE